LILPKEIPAELFDISSFDFIFGIDSYSITYLSAQSDKVYSLIELFKFKDESVKQNYIDYLNENSQHKIKYLFDTSELCS
jgi:hypothetical protein